MKSPNKMRKNIKRCMAIAAALTVGTGVFGARASAGSGTFTLNLSKGVVSVSDTGIEKSVANSPAQIISNKAVGAQDTVYAYAVNANGTIVSKEYATFRNTTGVQSKDAPYKSKKGVKGKKYKLAAKLDSGSKSNPLKVQLTFIP